MSRADSIKDRLKNISKETGKTMQELLIAYGLERTIYRISISRYNDNFTLKGGIFLYALFDGNYARATTDIDLKAEKISNDLKDMQEVFKEIFSLETDDPVRFDIDSLSVKSITEFKNYHGVNFGDVIIPGRVEMDFPVVLGDERPKIHAYSECSSISEKFEAIVSLAYDNSRFKDYYDIYVLSTTRDFDGIEMTEAVKETFEYRKTSLDEIVAFEEGFADDPLRQSRWKAFVKKKKALISVSLEDTIEAIEVFLEPVVEAINNNSSFSRKWLHEQQRWV